MVRQAALFAITLGLFRDPGCGDVDDPDGRTNAPCTRTSDCGKRLVCLEGVCKDPDAGSTSGGGGRDAGTGPDADAGDRG